LIVLNESAHRLETECAVIGTKRAPRDSVKGSK
jgi:hypothetical protein